MAKQANKSKSWEVLTLRKNDKGQVYAVFNKSIKVVHDEHGELDMGEYNTAFLKDLSEIKEDLDFRVEKGWISPEQAEENLAKLEEKGVKYSLRMRFRE